MNPKRKTAQIDRLATAIGIIATDFEKFGGLFLDALLQIPLNHQGTNLAGYPVAGVVDSVSDDGRIVAEYSDAGGYFDRPMDKAKGDLEKAIQRKPAAREIFLLSGQRKRPQIAQEFESAVRALPAMAGKTLHLWGAEEIAAHIVHDLILSDPAVRKLSPYLPELARIRDEEAATRLVPAPDPDRIGRPDIDAELVRRLSTTPAIAITGISGLGKSATASAYAADHEDEYDLAIWLEGDEVPRVEALHAMPLVRAGETRNIAVLLRTRACLLILDNADPSLPIDALAQLCGPRSRIILTRQIVDPRSYQLPMLTREEAQQLLDKGNSPCPTDALSAIWSTVGGHPFSLGLIAAAVRQGATWPELVIDCHAVGEMEDRGQRLADRLLGRLRPVLTRELSIFGWADQPTCGRDFLEYLVQPLGIRKLQSNGLTAADRTGVVRLHDVVFATLESDWCTAARRAELDAALERYLITTADESGLRFWTIARILRPKLEKLVESGVRSAVFRYALLSVWDPTELRPELVGDPLADAEALAQAVDDPLSIITIIEAIEQLFFRDKLESDQIAKTRLRKRLPAFDTLAAWTELTDKQSAQIQHHKAKALKRLGETTAAAALFEQVLSGPSPLPESGLQLIDLYRNDPQKLDTAIQLVDDILGRTVGEQNVTYSVLLGVIERLPWGSGNWRSGLIKRHAAAIETNILESAAAGVRQAFQAFAALGRYLSTEDPALFQRIFDALPKPTPETLETDGELFAVGEIYFEAARVKMTVAPQLRAQALAFYESEARPQHFHLQRRAELLIEMNRAIDAEKLLLSRNDVETSAWIQRLLARARFAQKDASSARAWIDKALANLKAEQFRSEFLELRYDIRTALGDGQASEDLIEARTVSQRSAESARLDQRLILVGLSAQAK